MGGRRGAHGPAPAGGAGHHLLRAPTPLPAPCGSTSPEARAWPTRGRRAQATLRYARLCPPRTCRSPWPSCIHVPRDGDVLPQGRGRNQHGGNTARGRRSRCTAECNLCALPMIFGVAAPRYGWGDTNQGLHLVLVCGEPIPPPYAKAHKGGDLVPPPCACLQGGTKPIPPPSVGVHRSGEPDPQPCVGVHKGGETIPPPSADAHKVEKPPPPPCARVHRGGAHVPLPCAEARRQGALYPHPFWVCTGAGTPSLHLV